MLKLGHKNLIVYKRSIELVSEIYVITNRYPSEERYGLVSQLRRSAVSVPSNIAEGASRKSYNERKRFYEISRSSLVEMDTQIDLSIHLKYLSLKETVTIEKLTNEIFAMLSKMV
ncbi:MAG: four helix bundle protein [Balneolaceae bacterium]